MKVKEMIEWLSTLDQDLDVEVISAQDDWDFNGNKSSYVSETRFEPNGCYHIVGTKTLLLGYRD